MKIIIDCIKLRGNMRSSYKAVILHEVYYCFSVMMETEKIYGIGIQCGSMSIETDW